MDMRRREGNTGDPPMQAAEQKTNPVSTFSVLLHALPIRHTRLLGEILSGSHCQWRYAMVIDNKQVLILVAVIYPGNHKDVHVLRGPEARTNMDSNDLALSRYDNAHSTWNRKPSHLPFGVPTCIQFPG